MKKINLILVSISFVFAMNFASCLVAGSSDKKINQESFTQFYQYQAECKLFIDGIAYPAINFLKKEPSIEDMRDWIARNKNYRLSILFSKIQFDTYSFGKINPKSKSDQKIIFVSLNKFIQLEPDFDVSACGPDVQEYLNEAIYLGFGGTGSKIAAQLKKIGIEESFDQRWALTALLMAGQIAIK